MCLSTLSSACLEDLRCFDSSGSFFGQTLLRTPAGRSKSSTIELSRSMPALWAQQMHTTAGAAEKIAVGGQGSRCLTPHYAIVA